MQAYKVFLGHKLIDKVFWNDRCDGGAIITANDVRTSLIDHDGYNSAIRVVKERKTTYIPNR